MPLIYLLHCSIMADRERDPTCNPVDPLLQVCSLFKAFALPGLKSYFSEYLLYSKLLKPPIQISNESQRLYLFTPFPLRVPFRSSPMRLPAGLKPRPVSISRVYAAVVGCLGAWRSGVGVTIRNRVVILMNLNNTSSGCYSLYDVKKMPVPMFEMNDKDTGTYPVYT